MLKEVDGSERLTLTVSTHNPLAPQRPVDIVMKFGFKGSAEVAALIAQQTEAVNK